MGTHRSYYCLCLAMDCRLREVSTVVRQRIETEPARCKSGFRGVKPNQRESHLLYLGLFSLPFQALGRERKILQRSIPSVCACLLFLFFCSGLMVDSKPW